MSAATVHAPIYRSSHAMALLRLAQIHSRLSWQTWEALADDLLYTDDDGLVRLLNAYYDKFPMNRPRELAS